MQVFDNNLKPRAVFDGVGQPSAICVTPGPHQYLFSSSNLESSPDEGYPNVAEIYAMELDGIIVGKLRHPDDTRLTVQAPHSLDCSVNGEIITADSPQNT